MTALTTGPGGGDAQHEGRFIWAVTASRDDVDEFGHVNNAIWVRWIQAIAMKHWEVAALRAHQKTFGWLVTRHVIDYRGNIGAGETVTGTTWVDNAARGARLDRHVVFHGADGAVKVEGVTTWAMIDLATRRPSRIPPEVLAPFMA